MDARLIPTVLPVIKKVIELERFRQELQRVEGCGEESKKIERLKQRLKENIQQLERELGYGNIKK